MSASTCVFSTSTRVACIPVRKQLREIVAIDHTIGIKIANLGVDVSPQRNQRRKILRINEAVGVEIAAAVRTVIRRGVAIGERRSEIANRNRVVGAGGDPLDLADVGGNVASAIVVPTSCANREVAALRERVEVRGAGVHVARCFCREMHASR